MSKRDWLKSVLIITAAIAVLSGATKALFTDTKENADNYFATGSLAIQLYDQNMAALSAPIFTCNNWAPGSTGTNYMVIKNNGTLTCDLVWKAQVSNTVMGPLGEKLANVLQAEVCEDTNGDNNYETNIYQGTLQDLETAINLGQLAPDQMKRLRIQVTMDTTAGNEYQGTTSYFKFIAEATQA